MPDHMAIIVVSVGLLVVFLIYRAIRAAREAAEEKRRTLRALGFEPLESPPPEVRDPILALHQRGKKAGHKLDHVFERRGGSERLVLFDLDDSSGDGVSHGAVAVFSPRLQVPRLAIFPRLESEGRLAALGNVLLKKLGERHGRTVEFADHPRFARRHFVSGPDEAAIRRFLTDRRLDRLAELEHISVEAEGHLFTCVPIPFGARVRTPEREAITHRVDLAEQLLRALGT